MRYGAGQIQLRPTCIAPPASFPVSLDEAKKHCHVDHGDDDAVIEALIEAATGHLDGLSGTLGRCMINQTWRFPFDAWPSIAAQIPLPDVSSIVIRYRDDADVEQTLDAGNYRMVETVSGSLVEWTSAFAFPALFERRDAVSIEAVAGYGDDSTDVPMSLRVSILMLVATWYEQGQVTSEELPSAVRSLIAPLRRNTLA